MKKPQKSKQNKIATARIDFLFEQAKVNFKINPKLSDSFIKIARRIAMKYRMKLNSQYKKSFCKECNSFLVPGVNCRVRIHKRRVIYFCFKCKEYKRHPIK